MKHFEQFNKELDAVIVDATGLMKDTPRLERLQKIRMSVDVSYNQGALADYQWRTLITRISKIQDLINGD